MMRAQKGAETGNQLVQPLEKVAQATTNEELAKKAKNLLQQAQRRAGSR
jgi:hypothetical protein